MQDKFIISLKEIAKPSTPKKAVLPEDYIEIIPKYIDIYQGCWIKYMSKETEECYPGGYLIEVTEDKKIILRNIRRDVFELDLKTHIFFCKCDSPNHKAVKCIIEEYDRLSIKIENFNIEKKNFLNGRKQLFL